LLRLPRQVIRLATAALVVTAVFGIGAPQVLGMASPSELRRSTARVRTIRMSNIAPGDSFSKMVRFHNYTSDPLDYRVVFVRQGKLWRCDPGGDSLYYKVVWSPGANQHLEPGETEVARITVHFPLAAGNECQGRTGCLLVRRGFIHASEKGGVYECRALPIFSHGREMSDADDRLDGHICWDVSGLLHPLLGADYQKEDSGR